MRPVWKAFRDFAVRGNVLDLATGVILGASFGKISTSLVNDVLMPPIGLALGKVDFSNLYISLTGDKYPSLAVAKAAGAPTINYGLFLNAVIDFLLVAFAIFLMLRAIERIRRKPEGPANTRDCPLCTRKIPLKAVRCPECTADIGPIRA